ncbi:hypothetical protein MN608_03989 [Microdochium nivale]|nr:hypothetical protein MN608_03989 [Microdochium nivale]
MSATPGDDLPGAFPDDATAVSQAHEEHALHQPNKLHKRNDPRGWTHDDTAPRTEADSASGFTSSHARDQSLSELPDNYTYGSQAEPTTTNTSAATTGARVPIHNQGQPASAETAGNPATQDSVSAIQRDDTAQSGVAGLAAGHGTAPTLSSDNTSTSATAEESTEAGNNVVRTGLGQKSEIDHQEPYWGNISRGAGTYNTVVGHGSAEDQVEGHPQHREFPLVGSSHGHGAHDTTTGTSSGTGALQDSSLTQASPLAGQGTYNTVVGHGSQEDSARLAGHSSTTAGPTGTTSEHLGPTTTSADVEHKDNHTKEIAAGAGAAGLGGYAAHKYASRDDESTDPTKTSSHDVKDHKHSDGLLHREHKEEPARHEKAEHEKEHKDSGESKILGIFSRSKKDKDHEEHSATTVDSARPIQDTTTTNPVSSGTHDGNDRHLGRDAALAGAGVAGAGYAADKHAHKDDDLTRQESDKSESKLHGLFHRSNKDKEISHKEREVPPNAAEYYNGKEAAQIAEAKERKGKANPEDRHIYGESSSTDPTTVTSGTGQHSSSDAHDGLGYAALGATGAAAAPAAYASHKEHEKHGHTEQTPSATTGVVPSATTQPTSREQFGQYDQLPSGTPSGIATGTSAGVLSSDNRSSELGTSGHGDQYEHPSSGATSGIAAGAVAGTAAGIAAGGLSSDHKSSGLASSGRTDQYDHLFSGTPSGVATGSTTGAVPSDNTSSNFGASGRADQYDHLASGTASGVAAGATAGALSSSGHRSSDLGSSGQTDQYDHLASGTPSGVAYGAPSSTTAGALSGDHTSSNVGLSGRSDPSDHLASGTASGIRTVPQDLSNAGVSPSSSSYSTDDKPSQGGNKLAYAGAGAAGAGAAAYGAHKLLERDDTTSQAAPTSSSTNPTSAAVDPLFSTTSAQPTSSSTTNPLASSERSADAFPSSTERHQPMASNAGPTLGAGVPVSTSGARKAEDHSALSNDPSLGASQRSAGLSQPSTGLSQPSTDLSQSSQTASQDVQYNVLSSGTPSGVKVEQATSASTVPHESSLQSHSTAVHDPLTSSSSQATDHSKAATLGGAAALAGAGAAGYAGTRDSQQDNAPMTTTTPSYDDVVANAPERKAASGTSDGDIHGRGLISDNERQIDTSTDPNAGSASYDNKPTAPQGDYSSTSSTAGGIPAGSGVFTGATGTAVAAARAATTGTDSSSNASRKPVLHTCTDCGKSNDISSYFSSEKDEARH